MATIQVPHSDREAAKAALTLLARNPEAGILKTPAIRLKELLKRAPESFEADELQAEALATGLDDLLTLGASPALTAAATALLVQFD